MNPFARGMGLIDRGLAAAAGVTLTLLREGEDGTYTGTIADAEVGQVVEKRDEQGRTRIEYGERQYVMPIASYALDGLGPVEPAVGDKLVETIGGVAVTFEVLATAGEKAWRFSDQTRRRYRVNVKETSDPDRRR